MIMPMSIHWALVSVPLEFVEAAERPESRRRTLAELRDRVI